MQGAPWPGGMIAVSRPSAWTMCGFESHVRLIGFSKRQKALKSEMIHI